MRHAMDNLKTTCPADRQIFVGTSVVSLSTWQQWRKPKNCSMVHIFAMGSGGGGGRGANAGAIGASAGGSGGGMASASYVTIPAIFLPDTLWLSVGGGGLLTAGVGTYVCVDRISNANQAYRVIAMGNGGAVGSDGNGATGGSAAAAGSVASATTMIFGAKFSPAYTPTGLSSTAGTVNTDQATLNLTAATSVCCPGGSGAGINSLASQSGRLGQNVASTTTFAHAGASGNLPAATTIVAGGTGTTGSGNNGAHGMSFINGLLQFSPGAGGASTATNAGAWTGGNGGDGGYGCGGGGGGGCFTGGTRGLGGKGGDGLVIITWW